MIIITLLILLSTLMSEIFPRGQFWNDMIKKQQQKLFDYFKKLFYPKKMNFWIFNGLFDGLDESPTIINESTLSLIHQSPLSGMQQGWMLIFIIADGNAYRIFHSNRETTHTSEYAWW